LVDPVEQLGAKLVEINTSEQNCMIDIVTSAARGTSLPEVQAVMARCRQASAAAATTAIDTFRSECSAICTQTHQLIDQGSHRYCNRSHVSVVSREAAPRTAEVAAGLVGDVAAG
jgi:predicted nucleic acid-binding protein